MGWLLPVSLAVLVGGIVISVLEEWKSRGLTDTSFLSLSCWVLGLLGVGLWALVMRDYGVFWVAFVWAALFFYWIYLKAGDRVRLIVHGVRKRERAARGR